MLLRNYSNSLIFLSRYVSSDFCLSSLKITCCLNDTFCWITWGKMLARGQQGHVATVIRQWSGRQGIDQIWWENQLRHRYNSTCPLLRVCVCVCVCVRERGKEGGRGRQLLILFCQEIASFPLPLGRRVFLFKLNKTQLFRRGHKVNV